MVSKMDNVIISANVYKFTPAMQQTSRGVVNPERRIGMSILTQKKCTKCGETKPLESFYRQKGCKDGRRPECKKCSDERINQYHIKNTEKRSRQHHERYLARKEEVLRYSRERFQKLKAHIYEVCKAYRDNNQEQFKERHKKYYAKNREKILETNKKYYRNHKDQTFKRFLKRKALLFGTGGELTEQDWQEVLQRYGNLCLMCGTKENITRDHVIPISRGGRNDKYNIQPLCGKCNRVKWTNSWDFRFDKGEWR